MSERPEEAEVRKLAAEARRLGLSPDHVVATELAERAMADLCEQTGDERSAYYTQGLTNWIPALVERVLAQEKVIEAARDLWNTHEIQMYVGDEAVSGGHIGYCSRRLGSELSALGESS